MAKRKYNLSPAGREALVASAQKLNVDPAAKAERIRQQMADPEFQKRRVEGFRRTKETVGVGRPRKVADSVSSDAITTSRVPRVG